MTHNNESINEIAENWLIFIRDPDIYGYMAIQNAKAVQCFLPIPLVLLCLKAYITFNWLNWVFTLNQSI